MEITNERYEELIKTEMLYRMTKNALKIGVPYPHILAMLGEPPVSVIKPISEPAPTTEPDEQKSLEQPLNGASRKSRLTGSWS